MKSTATKRCKLVGICLLSLFSTPLFANPVPHVDLVIALDVSSSMNGLIESAKQRLWDVVNELNQAQPQPTLSVALVTYGDPRHGQNQGFVRTRKGFTDDLDAINEVLFSLTTNGGDEYVARAVTHAIDTLQWSTKPQSTRVIFVAGNESAEQDPRFTLTQAMALAKEQGIVVNTLYCGDNAHADVTGWQSAAQLGGGLYASIDQNASAVANVKTPYDDKLAALNRELNQTYVAFGAEGERRHSRQTEQDKKVAELSAPAAASRAVTKASKLYRNESWDLVDAVASGQSIAEVEEADLPAELAALTLEDREAYVAEKAKVRQEIQTEVARIAQDRRAYVDNKRKLEGDHNGLDTALREQLRAVTKQAGMRYD